MIRLLLVDDHPIVLDGLEAALAPHEDLLVVARATTLAQARTTLQREDVAVALVDVRLPDGTGFELLDEAPERPAFIMLTTFHTAQHIGAAMRLGARGFLLKTAPTEEIVDAVRRVAAGGMVFRTNGEASQQGPTVAELTGREQQIVRAVGLGHTNREIAQELGISIRTVEWYLARLFERLDVRSRSELAVRAERGGWLEVGQPSDQHRP